MTSRAIAVLLGSLSGVLQAQTLLFHEDFESGAASSLAANGWTWIGNDPTFIAGPVSAHAAGRESPDLSVPPISTAHMPLLFHPLPYDPNVYYQVIASLYADAPFGSIAVANAGTGWLTPSGLSMSGVSWSDGSWATPVEFPALPIGPPGVTGEQFGILLTIGGSATMSHVYFDDLKVVTYPVGQATFAGKVFLDGPFMPGTGQMSTALGALSLLPLTEPYSALGYPQIGGGGESATADLLATDIVDWMRLELRSQADPTQVIATRQVLLARNGSLLTPFGTSPIVFDAPAGNYHVVVQHRNHLGILSANALDLEDAAFAGPQHDFSNAAFPVWGVNARKVVVGGMALWAGDASSDHMVKYAGAANDRDGILLAIGGTVPTATLTGQYRLEDVNLDGIVKYAGAANDRDVVLQTIGGTLPTSTRVEQLP
ncbi:MAG: hypothetical protein H6595_03680 [Flavobacteriales bacterium]|nr:hypothetical protein [Flavobacteriales bacterium]MCB9166560.1 hypothetical protein [Flavobacteriales bacterium]